MQRRPPPVGKIAKRPFLSDKDEWPDQSVPPVKRERGDEDEFEQTGDYAYVALAIGHWASLRSFPRQPPQWAIDACIALKERVDISTSPVIAIPPGPKVTAADDARLEIIAEILINKSVPAGLGIKPSVRAAIRFVLDLQEADDDNADYRRIARLWKSERDHRLKRAAWRTYKRLQRQGILKV